MSLLRELQRRNVIRVAAAYLVAAWLIVQVAEVAALAKEEAVKGFYGDRSIAVIPFDNLSSDLEQQFFADGVAEEVLSLLARLREPRVISRSSAFALRGENLEISEVAAQMGRATAEPCISKSARRPAMGAYPGSSRLVGRAPRCHRVQPDDAGVRWVYWLRS